MTHKIPIWNIFIVFLMCLMLLGTFNASNLTLKSFGLASIVILLVVTTFFMFLQIIKYRKVFKAQLDIIIFSSIYVSILLISFMFNPSLSGMINIFQFILCIGFLLFISIIKWNKQRLKILSILASLFILIHFLIWFNTGFVVKFQSIYLNPNNFAPFICYILFILIVARWYSKKRLLYTFLIAVSLVILLGTNSRSVLLSLTMAFFTYKLWGTIIKTKFRFVSFILIIFSILLFNIYIYPNLSKWDYFPYIDTIIQQYTGKRLMSGREYIWPALLDIIAQKPFLGHGPGTVSSDFIDFGSSAHNLYLQIALQTGYLGLISFFILLFNFWLIIWKARHNKIVQLSASFFITTLIHQSFEISLIQNQLAVGIMQWLVLGIGISFVIHKDVNKKQQHQKL